MLDNYTEQKINYVLSCCHFHVGSSIRRLVGRFSRVDRQGGIVMSTGASCIELCSGGMERGTLRHKNQRLRTSTRPLEVLM